MNIIARKKPLCYTDCIKRGVLRGCEAHPLLDIMRKADDKG